MLQISELGFSVSADGSLLIPASVLKEMGVKAGATVQVAYLTHDGLTNTFQEFMLSSIAVDEPDAEGDDSIRIPMRLMAQANIPEDADLQIACFNGGILICQDTGLQPQELCGILEGLQAAEKSASMLSGNVRQALFQLEQMTNTTQEREGAGENES